MAGAVTISIDLELAWGNWDDPEHGELARVETRSRAIVDRLVALFEKHQIAATWAIVAALLDPAAPRPAAGAEAAWYAPDIVEAVARSSAGHEIGSHGGRHLYFDRIGKAEAEADLAYARAIHLRHGLPFDSFVFPRNQIGKRDLLAANGIKVFRAPDAAWHQRVREVSGWAGRLANLADKALPIAPPPVVPSRDHGMVRLPSSMLFMGRRGVRALVPPPLMRTKLERGIAAAIATGRTFHLWFHPSNFYHSPDTQFALLDEFLAAIAERRHAGAIEVRTMGAFGR
jgi:hypothetical protein